MRDTILFDLDGTLLPMDFHKFMKRYFYAIGNFFKDKINPEELMVKINEATKYTVMTNDGRTNEEMFVDYFNKSTSVHHDFDMEGFYEFYNSDFIACKEATWKSDDLVEAVSVLKEKGYKLVVATNPLLPLVSNYHRIEWAGFNKDQFEYISSFEDNKYCKPHIEFYKEVLEKVNKTPERCYMVGNDRSEDLVAAKLGIETYLITDCEMDSHGLNIKANHEGTDKDFLQFVKNLPYVL